jgi:hypothetical protein
MACGLCGLEPRYGDNLALVRVMPGQPHWDALAENEPPSQTSVAVPACFDCRSEFSLDYFGLPAEMLGERPWAKPSQCCRLCKLPFRQGMYSPNIPILRILNGDSRYEELAKDEPPEQTSIGVLVCHECREQELPAYLHRTGLKEATLHLV